jgi:hypothetical protein
VCLYYNTHSTPTHILSRKEGEEEEEEEEKCSGVYKVLILEVVTVLHSYSGYDYN